MDLIEQGVDLAIRLGQPADSSLVARRLMTSQRMLIASARYLDRHGELATPEALLSHRIVAYSQFEGPTAWAFSQGTATVSVAVQPRLRVSAAEGLRSCVLSDLGIGMGSALMFTPELASGLVRQILPAWELPMFDVWAMLPAGRQATQRTRVFLDWFEGELKRAG